MFWALRNYSLPVIMALAMHASLALFVVRGIDWQLTTERVLQPRIVNATLLVLEPPKTQAAAAEPAPAPPPPPPPAPSEADRVDPRLLEAQRQKVEEAKAQALAATKVKREADERKVREERAREQRAAAERERATKVAAAEARAAQERQERLDALASSSFADALDKESAQLEEGEIAEQALSYFQGIRAKIIANWSRPASARNGMQATLRVELVPTGEVVSVALLESSGDAAFDRSAEVAVRKSRQFEVPRESAVFEARFRRFNLQFNPEDLLR